MSLIDLHVHSNASDGSLSPSEVVSLAAEAGLSAIAITDHDTVSGVQEALDAAADQNITVVPGVELSCLYHDREIHLLGLFINHQDPDFLKFLKDAEEKRITRNIEMLNAFQKDGFQITEEDLTCGNPKTIITRAHFARALVKRGYASSVDQAFKKYLNPDRPYYRKRRIITPMEALQAVIAADGFPVLAHPCLYKLGWAQIEELIVSLTDAGMKGLECFHSSNTQNESSKLRSLALKYHLFPTGGSDFHGAAKPDIKIGCGRGKLRVPAQYLDDIVNYRKDLKDR